MEVELPQQGIDHAVKSVIATDAGGRKRRGGFFRIFSMMGILPGMNP
ncbi:hypothetical protein ACFYW6_40165 [Streptomyces sp. NPDC002659]